MFIKSHHEGRKTQAGLGGRRPQEQRNRRLKCGPLETHMLQSQVPCSRIAWGGSHWEARDSLGMDCFLTESDCFHKCCPQKLLAQEDTEKTSMDLARSGSSPRTTGLLPAWAWTPGPRAVGDKRLLLKGHPAYENFALALGLRQNPTNVSWRIPTNNMKMIDCPIDQNEREEVMHQRSPNSGLIIWRGTQHHS